MVELRRKLVHCLSNEIKPWDNLILESKKFILRPSYLVVQFRTILCDDFCEIFPLGIPCNRKLGPKVISNDH